MFPLIYSLDSSGWLEYDWLGYYFGPNAYRYFHALEEHCCDVKSYFRVDARV